MAADAALVAAAGGMSRYLGVAGSQEVRASECERDLYVSSQCRAVHASMSVPWLRVRACVACVGPAGERISGALSKS